MHHHGSTQRALCLLTALCAAHVHAWADDAPADPPATTPATENVAAPADAGAPATTDAAPAAAADSAAAAATIPVEPLRTDASPQPAAPASTGDATQLEEVVVTATKRAKNVREIPATIVGFSGEQLERDNVKGMEDLARLVPGVNYTMPSEGTPRITIRGIAGQPATNATTGILYGDISFNDTYLPRVVPDPLPFDLQTVEILKGPQGTLFGAGALNGAIRYVPEPAKPGVWETKYTAEYTRVHEGDRGAPVYGAVVNAPLYGGDTAA
ncbi:MAG TPA: TonB-dependent receptor plug domain-containing protein, partial [Nevskiaceae bacterium]|nr:TonB-dependent receptor plug domain-containing protein [Nevskiaceae bacterium]